MRRKTTGTLERIVNALTGTGTTVTRTRDSFVPGGGCKGAGKRSVAIYGHMPSSRLATTASIKGITVAGWVDSRELSKPGERVPNLRRLRNDAVLHPIGALRKSCPVPGGGGEGRGAWKAPEQAPDPEKALAGGRLPDDGLVLLETTIGGSEDDVAAGVGDGAGSMFQTEGLRDRCASGHPGMSDSDGAGRNPVD